MPNLATAKNRRVELGLGQPHRGTAPALAATRYFRGGAIGLNADGRAVKAEQDGTGPFVVGVVSRDTDNTGGAHGATTVPYEYRLYEWFTHDGLTVADLKKPVYFEDDNTVVSDAEDGDPNALGGILHAIDGNQALVEILGYRFITEDDIED